MHKKIIAIVLIIIFLISGCPEGREIDNNGQINFSKALDVLDISIKKINFYSRCTTLLNCDKDKTPLKFPEYDISKDRNNPVAHLKDKFVKIEVQFKSELTDSFNNKIRANGSFGGFYQKKINFVEGNSEWITFESVHEIPDKIKNYDVKWNWSYQNDEGDWINFETTIHKMYSLRKKPSSSIFDKLANWTSRWCEGLNDNKKIADAIIEGFKVDKFIRYGGPQDDVAELLRTGDGMCGVITDVFHRACAIQGVRTIKSKFVLSFMDDIIWDFVILDPGLGQTDPSTVSWIKEKYRFIDKNGAYPYPRYYGDENEVDDVDVKVTSAYRDFVHVYNILSYNRKYYLYDLSFGKVYSTPFEYGNLPKPGKYYNSKDSELLQIFKKNYLDYSLDYLKRNIVYTNSEGDLIKDNTSFCVKTSLIPNEINGEAQLKIKFDYYVNSKVKSRTNKGLFLRRLSDLLDDLSKFFCIEGKNTLFNNIKKLF